MALLLDVQDISFSYDGERMIFENISFSVRSGEALCIIGPNGCGKTTLIDSILGMNKISYGDIILSEKSVKALKPREYAEKIAYVPQGHKAAFPYSVLDVVTMGRTWASRMFLPPGEDDRERARKAIAREGLSGFENREYTRLSGGELQLVLVARAIAQQSRILIMDEPTAHLDFSHELDVMELIAGLIRDMGISVVMATHFLNQAYFLENSGVPTNVALMKDGGFARVGYPHNVLTEGSLADIFGIDAEIVQSTDSQRRYILPIKKRSY